MLIRERYVSDGPVKDGNLLAALAEIEGVKPPKGKTELRRLQAVLREVRQENPLEIYVGSCPDYSHFNGLYTHESLDDNIPLLTLVHLQYDLRLIQLFDQFGIPYRYTIMVADVEAEDEIFRQRFAGGSREEFLQRCYSSVEATARLLPRLAHEFSLSGTLYSSSFFEVFGRDRFLSYQEAYQVVLHERYEADDSFSTRVRGDTAKRMSMYRKMYGPVLEGLSFRERERFLTTRTIRTMAQYLTLGRLIAEATDRAIIINHPTRNTGMFNSRNKFTLPGDAIQPQPTIPVFEIKKAVY